MLHLWALLVLISYLNVYDAHPCDGFVQSSNELSFLSLCNHHQSTTHYFVGDVIKAYICIYNHKAIFPSDSLVSHLFSDWERHHNFSSESFVGRVELIANRTHPYEVIFPIDFDHGSVDDINNHTCHSGSFTLLTTGLFNISAYH